MGSVTQQKQSPGPPPEDFPPAGDLRKMIAERPLPSIDPGLVEAMDEEEVGRRADGVLDAFDAAAAAGDAEALQACFFPPQAYWRDQLALTYHLRTFFGPAVITAAFLETRQLRGMPRGLRREGPAQLLVVSPVLQFIELDVVFRTDSATCRGTVFLLPSRAECRGERKAATQWKIWVLCTWVEDLAIQAEDESLLQAPCRPLQGLASFDTDVLIIGGGNSGVAVSARLKALGVESVVLERNERIGDNWGRRYDCLSLHTPTGYAQMPFMRYRPEYSMSSFLPRDELAEHLRRYVAALHLNVLTSARVVSTVYDPVAHTWTVAFQTPEGRRTASCKHLVQATGIGAQEPYVPRMENEPAYGGLRIHSTQFGSGQKLAAQGIQSVIVVGAASTGFDVMEDCEAAGLRTTLVARSQTYIVPVEYLGHAMSLGLYALDAARADRLFLATPTAVDSALAHGLLSHLARQEPGRYAALRAAGLDVVDSAHADGQIMHHLLERAGGHYVDTGATRLLAAGRVALVSRTAPVAYTATGLRFADGRQVDADAVVWCTGFADRDARRTAAAVLGGGGGSGEDDDDDDDDDEGDASPAPAAGGETPARLGPRAVAARLDTTWGLDAEGEVRGLWKRHERMPAMWTMGGHTQFHRWFSKVLALQIKAALAGVLPPAYRRTPEPRA